MSAARTALRTAALILAMTAAGCASSWQLEPWKPGMPVTEICDRAHTEEQFAVVKQLMTSWLDGELRLHALSPVAMEELTNAPISPTPSSLIWSYRFMPAPPAAGKQVAPALDHQGYPVGTEEHRRIKQAPRFLSLRVVTRDAIYNTPRYLMLNEPLGGMLATSFFPTRLGYHGALFNGDAGLHEYAAETRERGFGFLVPTVNDDADKAERVELRMTLQLNWSSAPREPGACTVTAKTSLPLPAGGTLWDRLNRLFLHAPLQLRNGQFQVQGHAQGEPAASAESDMKRPEAACDAGVSEGCFRAAMNRLHPPQPHPKTKGEKQVAAPLPQPPEPPRPEQVAAARELLRRGCDLGHGPACGVYGDMLRAAEKSSAAEATRSFVRACELDYGDGCTEVGRELEGRASHIEAERMFETGCRLGSGIGCYLQARAREREGKMEQDDLSRLALTYAKSCAYGVVLGCARYSFIGSKLSHGSEKVRESDVEEGYNLACGGGLPWACNALGLLHDERVRTKSQGAANELAQEAFEYACKAGDADGCANRDALKKGQPLRPLTPPPEGSPVARSPGP